MNLMPATSALLMRIRAAIRRKVLAYLEAGQRWQRNRTYLPGEIRDARFDVSSAERLEVVRKSRYFQYNNGIVNRLADLFEQYTVGPEGLNLTPGSDDDKWNDKVLAEWEGWCQYPDLTSLQSMGTLEGLMARLWFFDGEFLIVKTFSNSSGRIRPRIQLVETHRLATPSNMAGSEGRNIIDGIELDAKGRPQAYWIRESTSDPYTETFKRHDAKDVIHHFEPHRAAQYRGLPLIYPVINDIHDLDDLQMFEMQAAKQNAIVTRVVQNASGEDDEPEGRIASPFETKQRSTDTATVDREKYYKQVFGAEVKYVKHGDEYKEFVSQRPSTSQQNYWEYLITKICAGVGISSLLAYPTKMQGTVARADYDACDAFFRARSACLASTIVAIYHWWLDWEVNNNPALRGDRPGNWKRVTTCPPRSVNPDKGYSNAAQLSALKAGATTYEAIYAPQGKNWKRELFQAAREVAYIKHAAQLASDLYEGVTVEPSEVAEHVGVAAPEPAEPNPVTE